MARPRLRRVAPVRTVALESVTDLQAFRSAIDKRFTLPRVRIALRLSELHSAQGSEHERHINRLLSASGLAETTLAACLLLGLAIAFPLHPAGRHNADALMAWGAQCLLAFGIGGAAGWLIGKVTARQRLRRLCARVQAEACAPR